MNTAMHDQNSQRRNEAFSLVELLVVIRFYAKNRKLPAGEDAGNSLDVWKRIAATVILLLAVLGIADSLLQWSKADYYWFWDGICRYWKQYWRM